MNTRKRQIPRSLLYEGIIARMRRLGLEVDDNVALPPWSPVIDFGSDLGHLCFGDDEESFPSGVPVFGSLTVMQSNGVKWRASLPKGMAPYWTSPIRLFHQWNVPGHGLRPLHFLEAASLLTLDPKLEAVRYYSPKGSYDSIELRVDCNGQFRTHCGSSPHDHHAAYVEGPSPLAIVETQVSRY